MVAEIHRAARDDKIFMFKRLLAIILALALVCFQLGLIDQLGYGLSWLNLPLVSLVFALNAFSLNAAWFWLLAIGLPLEYLSFHPFGLMIGLLAVILLVDQLLLKHWLTDRSAYTLLILTAVSVLLYELGFWLGDYLLTGGYLTILDLSWNIILPKVGANFLLAAGLLIFNNALNHRFRPVFLEQHR